MEALLTQAITYLTAAGGIVLAANAITVLTPTKLDDKYVGKLATGINFVLKILNVLAVNIGKNTNADAK